MNQNYVFDINKNSVIYKSNSKVFCNTGNIVEKKEVILKVLISQNIKNKMVRESRKYFGCSGFVSFTEIFKFKQSDNNIQGDLQNYLTKKINFFEYQLVGPSNEIFVNFKLADKYQGLWFLSQRVLTIKQTKTKFFTSNKYSFFPYNLEFAIFNSKLKFSRSYFRDRFISGKKSHLRFEFFNSKSEPISFSSFQNKLQFNFVKDISKELLIDLPKTSFVSSGNQNVKLLNELRNAQAYLDSNTNIDFVRNLILQYIDAATKNRIIDNRE